MMLLKAEIFFFIVWTADHIQAKVSPDGENVCLETEIHQETIVVSVPKPKTVTTRNWCWKFWNNFECKKTTTVTVYENESRVVNRPKIVAKCCDGYREEKVEVTKCVPACLRGCVNGKCIAPELCVCKPGFYGANCGNACPKDFWGENCSNKCNCSENGKCLPESGECVCEPGWHGTRCELQCQDGYYGFLCKEKCECENQFCNHITGQCVGLVNLSNTTMVTTTENSIENLFHSNEFTSTPYWISTTELFEGNQTEEFDDKITEKTKFGITDAPNIVSMEEKKINPLLGSIFKKNDTDKFIPEEEDGNLLKTEKSLEKENESNSEGTLKETKTFSENEETTVSDKTEKTLKPVILKESNDSKTAVVPLTPTEENEYKNEIDFVKEKQPDSDLENEISFFRFLPTLSVLSGFSFILLITAAGWVIVKHQRKTKIWECAASHRDIMFQMEEKVKHTPDFFSITNCTKNSDYLFDTELKNTTTVLQTFKPVTENKGFVAKEGVI